MESRTSTSAPDTGTPVSNDYQVSATFNDKLNKLTLVIERPQLSPADIEKLKQAMRNNRTSEQRIRSKPQASRKGCPDWSKRWPCSK